MLCPFTSLLPALGPLILFLSPEPRLSQKVTELESHRLLLSLSQMHFRFCYGDTNFFLVRLPVHTDPKKCASRGRHRERKQFNVELAEMEAGAKAKNPPPRGCLGHRLHGAKPLDTAATGEGRAATHSFSLEGSSEVCPGPSVCSQGKQPGGCCTLGLKS